MSWLVDAENTEYVAAHLPQSSHCDDPAVALSVDDGLSDVCDEGQSEKDGVEVGGAYIGAKEGPIGFGVVLCWAVDCHYGMSRSEIPVRSDIFG